MRALGASHTKVFLQVLLKYHSRMERAHTRPISNKTWPALGTEGRLFCGMCPKRAAYLFFNCFAAAQIALAMRPT
jgi:hypothetical protein